VDSGSERHRLRALSVAITNNGYDETTPWLKRPRLDQGKLTMYVSHHRNGWGMAMAVMRALLGLWRDDRDVTKIVGTKLVVHSGKRRRRLSNDGEIAKYDEPLVYDVVPQSLTVLMQQETT
jgi:diacylglycerol kinase family enzyme